jgi:hypothetical protein
MYYTSIEDLNLFYEVGDAPFGLYWVSPEPTMFDEPFRTRSTGASQTQRFPFKFPVPGSPDNATLDYSIYLPISFSPGFDIQPTAVRRNTTTFNTARVVQEHSVDLGVRGNPRPSFDLTIRCGPEIPRHA